MDEKIENSQMKELLLKRDLTRRLMQDKEHGEYNFKEDSGTNCVTCGISVYQNGYYPFILDKDTGEVSQFFPHDYYRGDYYKMYFCTRKCVEIYKLNPVHLAESSD